MQSRRLIKILALLSVVAGIVYGVDRLLIRPDSGVDLAQAEKLKVGFVYVGPVGDHGWTYRHDVGRQAIEQSLGADVSTSFVESVSEGADAERVIRKLASSGHDLIFTTSFGYMNPTVKVAQQFKNVKFEHATGYKRSDNIATYSARFYEAVRCSAP